MKGEKAMLIPESEIPKTSKDKLTQSILQIDKDRCAKFREFLRRTDRLAGKSYSPRRWGIAFRMLRAKLGDKSSQIDEILDWYISWWKTKDQFPTINDPRQFYTQWDDIVQAKDKDQRYGFSHTDFTKDGERTFEKAAELHWPKDSVKQLRPFIETSLANYKDFRTKLEEVEGDLERFAKWFKTSVLSPYPTRFIGIWVEETHRMISKWNDWSGKLNPFVFRVESKRFQEMGVRWARKYTETRGAKLWADLMEELGYEVGEK